MKNGTSSGGVSVELIKYGRDRLKERIRNLIDRVVKCCKNTKGMEDISHFFNIQERRQKRS